VDPACSYPFTKNNRAAFIEQDIRKVRGADLAKLYPAGSIRLLAGCAPCRPFSPFQRGSDSSTHDEWALLDEFGRIVRELRPDLVTMENVPDLAAQEPFKRFVRLLKRLAFDVAFDSVYGPDFGMPQHRRRLVLVASRIGLVSVPAGRVRPKDYKTVRDAIGGLPPVRAGEQDAVDRLHKARGVSDLNMRRLKASRPGGTWRDWEPGLRAACHQKTSGSSYQAVYSRMTWDEPAPTITTLASSFGSGRFGHPEQNRSLTLREAAILQTFPRRYRFVAPREPVGLSSVGRLIGNAVPPRLAWYVGKELMRVAHAASTR
jgi:DNA (cytosine-5)-methyltransferase 1